jgi:hypothetical protein
MARRTQRPKDQGKKMAAPKSGQVQGGNAQEGRAAPQSGSAMPRCNNMEESRPGCKAQKNTISDKMPQKHWKKSQHLPQF